MTFYRGGKRLNYLEVIETLDSLIKKDILLQLEEQEVNKLFLRIFDATKEMVITYLKEIGYKTVDIRQAFVELAELKVISHYEVWDKAIEIHDGIIAGESKKDEMVSFMMQALIDAMTELNARINKKL